MWGMPPAQRGEVVAPLEAVWAGSRRPDAPPSPLVGRDAHPVPWIQEVRQPLPAQEGTPEREAEEYERHGTANIFLGTEPLRGLRAGSGRAHKTAVGWAPELPRLLDTPYPEADRIRLVCANRQTHGRGAL
jgi:hypothetical protein